ncbi:hypothetical protein [Gellertiella hungarica]|uniref:Uncharacterized protein n=1 Tax=Gellertiella hungarica TaxID=1572859 RepID=A0A7W6J4C8_9HYPH|nr:hypothetical protein [Gellertiella hungarica]MBB4063681.1 hypothetical protein [Gellertiella hungarica]
MMTDDQYRELKRLILDVAQQVEEVKQHLKRQDKESMEILAASRRLMFAIEAIDDGEEVSDTLQN